jgi:hypothetical protein
MTPSPPDTPPDRNAAARRERRAVAGLLALVAVAALAVGIGGRAAGRQAADAALVWVGTAVVLAMAAFVLAVALFYRRAATTLAPVFPGFIGAVGVGFFVADELPPVWRAVLALGMTVLAGAALWGVWYARMGSGAGPRRRG